MCVTSLLVVSGFGFLAGAALLGLLISRGMGLQTRLMARAEKRTIALEKVTTVLRLALVLTIVVKAVVATLIMYHLNTFRGERALSTLWNGVFHAVSTFNKAGFSTYPDSLISLSTNGVILRRSWSP
ncbi:MAG: hypothetical protein H7245_08265 [Candidatus Saccharibacteria bacterium]|nr:hypothetical protein [Pseudorhodobacter sp.]